MTMEVDGTGETAVIRGSLMGCVKYGALCYRARSNSRRPVSVLSAGISVTIVYGTEKVKDVIQLFLGLVAASLYFF